MSKITTEIIKEKNKKHKKKDKDTQLAEDIQAVDLRIERFDAVAGDDLPIKLSSEEVKKQYFVPILEKLGHLKYDENKNNVDKINQLRGDYLQRSTKFNSDPSPDEYWRENDPQWEEIVKTLTITSGILDSKSKVLLLEPRWVNEVFSFKKRFGFENVAGVASFSTNENVISIGDMHTMKFDSNTFDVIYQRNTLSLSYNVRALLDECIRILKNNSILIIDNALDYKIGVNPIIRTNIHSTQWIIEFLKTKTTAVLYNKEVIMTNDARDKYGQLIIQIRK